MERLDLTSTFPSDLRDEFDDDDDLHDEFFDGLCDGALHTRQDDDDSYDESDEEPSDAQESYYDRKTWNYGGRRCWTCGSSSHLSYACLQHIRDLEDLLYSSLQAMRLAIEILIRRRIKRDEATVQQWREQKNSDASLTGPWTSAHVAHQHQ